MEVFYLIFLTFVTTTTGLLNKEDKCKSQQVNAAFCFDATTNVRPEQWQYMIQLTSSVTETFPGGSQVSRAYVSDVNIPISKTPVLNTTFTKQLQEVSGIPETTGRTISSNALDNEVNARFTATDYKKNAEILYLIVTDETDIEEFPANLLKKKLFIIVLGESIPQRLKDLASSDRHVYLIRDQKDVRRVANLVVEQTCIDSHFKCDVNQYMETRSIKCKSCMSVCSSVTKAQSESCLRYCPYVQIPPKDGAVKSEQISDQTRHVKVDDRAKGSTLITVGWVLIIICIVGVNIGVYNVCRRIRLACFGMSPAENDPNQIEMQPFQPVVPDSKPVEETMDTNDRDEDQENDNVRQPLAGNPICTVDEYNEGAQGFVIPFKNNKELDMNGEVFGEPGFQPVH